jgi:hypothetical protein
VSIMAGSLDTPTGLFARQHIFVALAGDYYEILDGLQQILGGPDSAAMPLAEPNDEPTQHSVRGKDHVHAYLAPDEPAAPKG